MTNNAQGPWQAITAEPLELGEGARIDGETLRWVDLLRGELFSWAGEPADAPVRTHRLARPLGVAERAADGRLIAALGTGVGALDEHGGFDPLADTGLDGARHRVNDGAIAPDGSLWFGTMVHDDSPQDGAVWRADLATGAVSRLLGGIAIPNGPTFLPDGRTALIADSAAGRILRTPVDAPSETALFAEVDGGSPDGMHVDPSGRVWSAVWGASRADVYDQDGAVLARVELPVAQPTSIVVTAGPAPRVIVTSATIGLEQPGPLDGHTIVAPLAQAAPGL